MAANLPEQEEMDKDAAKISVCIPAYNGAKYIGECIQSVLAQTHKDFELLIVDDNSTDRTAQIILSFRDSRIRLIQNPKNRGIPENWNYALSLARGEYICIFHQDDVMRVENLERKYKVLAADPGIAFIHSAADVLLEKSAPPMLAEWNGPEDSILEGAAFFRRLLFNGNPICCPSVMARRQRLLDVNGFDNDLGYTCDYATWMKLCLTGRVAYLKQPLIQYRWHRQNASHGFQNDRGFEESIAARRRAIRHFVEKGGRREEGDILEEALEALVISGKCYAELNASWTVKAARLAQWPMHMVVRALRGKRAG